MNDNEPKQPPVLTESEQAAINNYAEVMIRRDQLARDAGKPEHDRDTFGNTLRPGT